MSEYTSMHAYNFVTVTVQVVATKLYEVTLYNSHKYTNIIMNTYNFRFDKAFLVRYSIVCFSNSNLIRSMAAAVVGRRYKTLI